MKKLARVIARLSVALIGAIGFYLALYWVLGWSSYNLGYESGLGKSVAFVSGAISPLAWGIAVVLVLFLVLFWALPKFLPMLRAR